METINYNKGKKVKSTPFVCGFTSFLVLGVRYNWIFNN